MSEDRFNLLSRRELLRQILGISFLPWVTGSPTWAQQKSDQSPSPTSLPALSVEDDQFLNEVENASFLFFWEQGSPRTGMVKDRCDVRAERQGDAASIAATGFGLTALCIGAQRGFIPTGEALERVFITLRFLARKLPTHRGFFFHFANVETGERMWESEVSSVDTAILLCGVLTCRQYFDATPKSPTGV